MEPTITTIIINLRWSTVLEGGMPMLIPYPVWLKRNMSVAGDVEGSVKDCSNNGYRESTFSGHYVL